ncbi:MAG: hypothetical protein LIP01_07395, partial [Tannerellaceae bacterium]|nr:hypothetical protein [Tannerellaceae bacterium]
DTTLIGGILAATSLFCVNKFLKFLLYKSDKFQYIMEGEPIILIRHGKLNKKELEKTELISGN